MERGMRVEGKPYRTIWANDDAASVTIIDQTLLPHRFKLVAIADAAGMARAIKDMQVRGAPLIGIAAAYGVALAMRSDPSDANLELACARLKATRPTAVNLQWALDAMQERLAPLPPPSR